LIAHSNNQSGYKPSSLMEAGFYTIRNSGLKPPLGCPCLTCRFFKNWY
jgi:hypothetical protein